MKTKEEITEFITQICKETEPYKGAVNRRDFEVDFKKYSEKEVLFEVTMMYESPIKLNLATLKRLSEFFGTDNIDNYDDISHSGCETCDYGSSYGVAIRVWY